MARALLFEPEAFVEWLCALIWKPRVNTVHYHGIFASGSAWRAEVVPDGVRRQKRARLRRAQGKRLGVNERWMLWLSMLSHVFGNDERCPGCGAKRWVFDAVLGPWRVRRELLALGIDLDFAARLRGVHRSATNFSVAQKMTENLHLEPRGDQDRTGAARQDHLTGLHS